MTFLITFQWEIEPLKANSQWRVKFTVFSNMKLSLKEMCKAFQIRITDHLLTYSQKFLACEIVLQK